MLYQKKLDRALALQKEQAHPEGTAFRTDPDVTGETVFPDEALSASFTEDVRETGEDTHVVRAQDEKVPFGEFVLMSVSAFAVIVPVCLVILIGMVVIARLLFRI